MRRRLNLSRGPRPDPSRDSNRPCWLLGDALPIRRELRVPNAVIAQQTGGRKLYYEEALGFQAGSCSAVWRCRIGSACTGVQRILFPWTLLCASTSAISRRLL